MSDSDSDSAFDVEKYIGNVHAAIRAAGMTVSKQREQVARTIASGDSPMSHGDIVRAMNDAGQPIQKVSATRVLRALREINAIVFAFGGYVTNAHFSPHVIVAKGSDGRTTVTPLLHKEAKGLASHAQADAKDLRITVQIEDRYGTEED